jgi:hypothetical protein
MKLNKIQIAAVITFCIAVITFFTVLTDTSDFKCIFANHFGFKKVGENIFLPADISIENENNLLQIIKKSKVRAGKLFGVLEANPIILVCTTNEELKTIGSSDMAGSTRRDILGTFVVIGPSGLNEDVISHELVHSEFGERIGLYSLLFVPAWFDEGLALQVDYRAKYSEEVWNQRTENGQNIPDISTLAANKQFYTGDRELHYVIARHDVKNWMEKVGKVGLLDLTARVNKGASFSDSYEFLGKEESDMN